MRVSTAPNLNKLSIQLLADAFAVEEASPRDGQVIAIYGRRETIDTIQAWLLSLKRDNFGTIFGKPFVVSPKVPESSIVLGCVEQGRGPYPEDFPAALNDALDSLTPSKQMKGRGPVWGTVLRLT